MRDPYLYSNSEVLINLADIHNEEILKEMEADYTTFRLSAVVTDDTARRFDFEGLCNLHYYIFQDIYEWAGKPRVINIEKEEGVLGDISIEYSDCFDIAEDTSRLLRNMGELKWEQMSLDLVVKQFSDNMAELWKVHPFREGNTRTIVTFCCLLIEAQGIYIESDLFRDNAVYMRNALVAASAIFSDLGDLRKPEYLYRIVEDALEKGQSMKEQICEQIEMAGYSPTEQRIRKIILWNRKTKSNHTIEEIREYLR